MAWLALEMLCLKLYQLEIAFDIMAAYSQGACKYGGAACQGGRSSR
jgi:hypothetical protein